MIEEIKRQDELRERVLWQNYRKEPNRAQRDALITHYLWLVRYVCGRIAMELPARIREEDLFSSGVVGLIEAVDKYEEAYGSSFKTYAFSRVRGAVMDELRQLDWAPRLVRRRARDIERACRELEGELKRRPRTEEIARAVGLSPEEVELVFQDVSAIAVLSLEETLFSPDGHEKAPLLVEALPDNNAVNPKTQIEERQIKEFLTQAIQALPEKQRVVLALYYVEELTLKEIGRAMELTESRVCQIHAQAIASIQRAVRAQNRLAMTE